MDLCYELAFMHETIAIAQSLMNVYIQDKKGDRVGTAGDQNQEIICNVL